MQRQQSDARNEEIDDEEDENERNPDPSDVLDEFLQYAVVDDIAGMEGHLHPDQLILERCPDGEPVIGLLLVGLKNEKVAWLLVLIAVSGAVTPCDAANSPPLRSTTAKRPLLALNSSTTYVGNSIGLAGRLLQVVRDQGRLIAQRLLAEFGVLGFEPHIEGALAAPTARRLTLTSPTMSRSQSDALTFCGLRTGDLV